MGNYKIEEEKKTANQKYMDYIERCKRTSDKSRLEIHLLKNTQNVGKYYGLSDADLEYITKKLKEEENKEE